MQYGRPCVARRDFSTITQKILSWYKKNRRDLPWRRTKDPYHIWISEIMLQQTQVDTVIPFYERFLSKFPTVQTLAAARLDRVLKAWENMGYYARARHLHAAAKQIVQECEGKIPDRTETLLRLPGIGRYTAGAILSIAFGKPVPVVDANVRRVLSRIFALQEPVNNAQVQQRIWRLAEKLVPARSAGHFNQGLMDLGAMVCTPRAPACRACPLKKECLACQRNLQDMIPPSRKRRPVPHKDVTAGIIRNGNGQVLIVQRPAEGLLGGLWKWPGGIRENGENLKASLRRTVLEEMGVRIQVGRLMTTVDHAYTHFRITLHVFECRLKNGEPQTLTCRKWRWAAVQRLNRFAFSKADRAIIQALTAEKREKDGMNIKETK